MVTHNPADIQPDDARLELSAGFRTAGRVTGGLSPQPARQACRWLAARGAA